MKKIIIAFTVGLLTACSSSVVEDTWLSQPKNIVVSAVGLGAAPESDAYSADQKTLMAIQASKVDAYASLVEKIYGLKINSATSVRSLVIEKSMVKTAVEGLIQAADVKEIRPIGESSYETTLQVEITPEFRSYILKHIQ